MFEYNINSKNFVLLCSNCGHAMPLENMKIIGSSFQSLGPCIEIKCTSCNKRDYLISR